MASGDFGKISEQHAVEYLTEKGYRIVCRNYRTPKGEVDIIAKHGEMLCVVEVKARSSICFGTPQQAVTAKKIQRIVETTHQYIMDNGCDAEVRFDIIAITKQADTLTIEHIEDAFKAV